MSRNVDEESRRGFLKTSTAAVGGLALAVNAGCAQEKNVEVIEINAILPTSEQMQNFLGLPERPVLMLNLLKFQPDGGAEEYAKYVSAVGPLLHRIGARVLISGEAATCLIGKGDWDMIALVEYPSPAALAQMIDSDEYKSIHHHREAGLEGQILYAVLQHQSAA